MCNHVRHAPGISDLPEYLGPVCCLILILLFLVLNPHGRRPRTSSPNNNNMPDPRTIQQRARHLHRHHASCCPGNIHLVEAVPVGIASAVHHTVLEEGRTGPVADLVGLVDRGSGFRRSNQGHRHLGCSMRVACLQEQDQRRSEQALGSEGIEAVRLGPASGVSMVRRYAKQGVATAVCATVEWNGDHPSLNQGQGHVHMVWTCWRYVKEVVKFVV